MNDRYCIIDINENNNDDNKFHHHDRHHLNYFLQMQHRAQIPLELKKSLYRLEKNSMESQH